MPILNNSTSTSTGKKTEDLKTGAEKGGRVKPPFVQASKIRLPTVTPAKKSTTNATAGTTGTAISMEGYVEPNPEDIIVIASDNESDTINENEIESHGDDKKTSGDVNTTEPEKNNKEQEDSEKETQKQNKNEKSNENNKKKEENNNNMKETNRNTDSIGNMTGTGSEKTDTDSNTKTGSTAPTIYMPFHDFKNWDLEHPPKLVSQFWMEHPKVVNEAMKHWIYTNIEVAIPYKWNAVDYVCNNRFKPREAKKGEKYKEMTMLDVVELCEAFIIHPKKRHNNLKGDEKSVKYSPNIVKARNDLVKALEKVKKMTADVLAVDRHIEDSKDGNDTYLRKVKIMAANGKRKLKKLKEARDTCEREIRFAIETIEMAVTLKKEAAANKKQSNDDAMRIKRLFAAWNDGEEEEDEDDDLMSITGTDNNTISEHLKTASNEHTNNIGRMLNIEPNQSQISEITSKTSQTASTTVIDPATTIDEVEYSQCDELKIKYNNMMNDNINIEHKHSDVTVLLHPDTMRVLNHDTKEITKIESNELQQSECHRWNSAAKLEIYKSQGVYVKCLRNRPKIIPINALKNNPKVEKLETQLDHIVKQFQAQAQSIINEYTELEVEHMEKKRYLDLETSIKKIIRSHATYILHQEREQQHIKNVLNKNYGNSIDTSLDEACGYTYLLLLTGEACTSLIEWSETSSPVNMMKALTSTLAVPQRLTEEQVQKRAKGETLRIGSMTFLCPNEDVWALAQQTASGLHGLVAEISLGMKSKFYRKIIESKGNHAVRELRYTTDTIDMTAKVSNVLLHASDIETKYKISRNIKSVIQSTVDILVKKNKSIKSTSAALKSKNKTINQNPNATTTNNNRNELDNNKKSEKTKILKQNENSTILKIAARENTQYQQQQQQQHTDDTSTTTTNSNEVAASMRQQRNNIRPPQQYQQQYIQQHNQQYQQPYQQYQQQQQYQFDYNTNEHAYNPEVHWNVRGRGRGRGRGGGRGGGRGRGRGRGYIHGPITSPSKRQNGDHDNYNSYNNKKPKNY
jgi:hypothetical protein